MNGEVWFLKASIVCVWMLPACMSLCHMHVIETGGRSSFETQSKCWGCNAGPLGDQQVLFISELSCWPYLCVKFICIGVKCMNWMARESRMFSSTVGFSCVTWGDTTSLECRLWYVKCVYYDPQSNNEKNKRLVSQIEPQRHLLSWKFILCTLKD